MLQVSKMDERLILKSEQRKLKAIFIILFLAAALFILNGAYYMIDGIVSNVKSIYNVNPDIRELYGSKADYIMFVVGKHFDSFIVLWIIGAVLIAAAVVVKKTGKCLLILSNKAIYGFDFWGRKVEIPLTQVKTIKKSASGGIQIGHSSGTVKFMFIKNRDAVFGEVINALNTR